MKQLFKFILAILLMGAVAGVALTKTATAESRATTTVVHTK
ncbi:hypothetical protein [Levilactobacillus tongjiangensis]|uniref:Uncharacterized protein n=1 Tax=Levilactobacillus tongjiangensis TaxID=2486023 RepID=A0ABW1SRN9_9LACO|nr:hypothetical protein [Levilactobacillus tongjiangensis]